MGIVIRQSIKGTIVTYVGAFIGFLITIFIIPKYLDQEAYGLTRTLLAAATLFSSFTLLGTNASAIRFFPYFKNIEKKNNGFFFYLVAIPLIGCLIFVPLFFCLQQPIYNFYQKESPLFIDYHYWLIPLVFFITYWGVFETYSSILLRVAVPKFIREILLRALIIVVYMLYALGFIGMNGFIAAFIMVYGIAMTVTFFYTTTIGTVSLRHDFSFVSKPLKKEYLSYTSMLIFGAVGASVLGLIDTLFISSMKGLSSTAVYSVAFYIVAIVSIPSRSLMSMASPLVSAAMQRKDRDEACSLFRKVSINQLLIGSLVFVIIWINIDNVYAIMPNGDNYKEGKWVIFFIGLSQLVQLAFHFGGTIIQFSKYYRWALYLMFVLTGLAILFNYLLIPVYGITGAAISTLLACILNYSFQQVVIYRKLKMNPYSYKYLILIAIIIALFGINYILPVIQNPWIDGIYRTVIIGITGVAAVYFFRISEDMNALMRNSILLLNKKICYTYKGAIENVRLNKIKKEILTYYSKHPIGNNEINKAIQYLSNHKITPFPYSFIEKYKCLDVKVFTDKDNCRYYVMHNGKRLYCTQSVTYKGAQLWYNGLLMEQDIESPHRYLTGQFNVNQNDIVVDVGCAEGILSLDIIDKVKKVYLFEYEDEWIEALKLTFEPWKEKVEIIKKYVSDNNNDNNMMLDSFFEGKEEKPTFIKIDVEGAEIEVLTGMNQLLNSTDHLKLVICTYHKNEHFQQIATFVENMGMTYTPSEKYMLYYKTRITPPYFRKGLIRAIKKD